MLKTLVVKILIWWLLSETTAPSKTDLVIWMLSTIHWFSLSADRVLVKVARVCVLAVLWLESWHYADCVETCGWKTQTVLWLVTTELTSSPHSSLQLPSSSHWPFTPPFIPAWSLVKWVVGCLRRQYFVPALVPLADLVWSPWPPSSILDPNKYACQTALLTNHPSAGI